MVTCTCELVAMCAGFADRARFSKIAMVEKEFASSKGLLLSMNAQLTGIVPASAVIKPRCGILADRSIPRDCGVDLVSCHLTADRLCAWSLRLSTNCPVCWDARWLQDVGTAPDHDCVVRTLV